MQWMRACWLLIVAALLFGGGYIAAQQTTKQNAADAAIAWSNGPRDEAKNFYDDIDAKKSAEEMLKDHQLLRAHSLLAYTTASGDFVESEHIAINALYDYQLGANRAKSAVQATQVYGEQSLKLQSLQVVQNARIILLLQKIADKQK